MGRQLPQPVTATEMYLAAVLDELRTLNQTMQTLTQRANTAASTSDTDASNVRSNNKPRKNPVEHVR